MIESVGEQPVERMFDVANLRSEARARAASRNLFPFAGDIRDWIETVPGGRPAREYTPEDSVPRAGMVFLHGGYGLFGDLNLQDGYCRRLASALGIAVLSVDYRLAPESTIDESVDDVIDGLEALARGGRSRLFLCGDSAGGALAIIAARRFALPIAGLLLTNPNVDLTLGLWDVGQEEGPDRGLSEFAFRTWAGHGCLRSAPQLQLSAVGLPPTMIAVGSQDTLVPEARALAAACDQAHVDRRLVELAGVGHGFVGGDHVDEVLVASREFLRLR